MRRVLEATPNLHLRQGVVVDLIIDKNTIVGLELQDTRRLRAKAVIIATGTFLNGKIHTGQKSFSAGRSGEPATIELAESLKKLGFPVGRLKTGTPPRLDSRTIDWDAFEAQPADEKPVAFSFATEKIEQPQITCHIGYTNEELHDKIRQNLYQSPLYSGKIKGIGPRYCPSIEDKVVKFADKNRHQLFLEPEGHNTNEVYLNGFSTSLPAELQQNLLKMINGFKEVKIIRPGYAIEYDFVDPRELKPSMETTRLNGLFLAGQINGTTGYEEAACQGLMAGINAAFYAQKRDSIQLRRNSAYIGVLIDDLIQHGVDEPYRIFTSRAEARLTLRHDNADQRLSPIASEIGLLTDSDWNKFNEKQDRIAQLRNVLESTRFKRSDHRYVSISQLLGVDLGDTITLAQLSQRQGVNSEIIFRILPEEIKTKIKDSDLDTALADLLYRGYLETQKNANERIKHNDNLKIPKKIDFQNVNGLSNEMIERLERSKPHTFGQIRNISGLTPSAISTLLVYLTSQTSK
jgi:tRNA uridine 5-carboxymethylaminomethyl modification enzyme